MAPAATSMIFPSPLWGGIKGGGREVSPMKVIKN